MQRTLTPALLDAIVMRVRESLQEDEDNLPRSTPRLSYGQMEEAIVLLADELESRPPKVPQSTFAKFNAWLMRQIG